MSYKAEPSNTNFWTREFINGSIKFGQLMNILCDEYPDIDNQGYGHYVLPNGRYMREVVSTIDFGELENFDRWSNSTEYEFVFTKRSGRKQIVEIILESICN